MPAHRHPTQTLAQALACAPDGRQKFISEISLLDRHSIRIDVVNILFPVAVVDDRARDRAAVACGSGRIGSKRRDRAHTAIRAGDHRE